MVHVCNGCVPDILSVRRATIVGMQIRLVAVLAGMYMVLHFEQGVVKHNDLKYVFLEGFEQCLKVVNTFLFLGLMLPQKILLCKTSKQ